MKIEKLVLRNFASIYNAMDAKEITIDFKKSRNKICLLIGKNGGGKSSILSMLTPFSDVGNLDVRNNQPLILKDKEGYKEIHISRDGNYYIIKHIYTPHKDKSHSLKSYIEKNGIELNVNGNVRSFLEIVKTELSIEPEYLKLVRLGSNVTNIIGLTETERKNFMSKIMSDIDVYVDYYKIVGTKERQIKDNISHIANKLSKLGISDVLIANKEINLVKKEIEEIDNLKTEVSNKIAIHKHVIDGIEDTENLRDNLNHTSRLVTKMKDTLSKYKPDKLSSDHYKNEIDNIEKEITKVNSKLDSLDLILPTELSSLNSLLDRYQVLSNQYEKELNNEEIIKQMEDNLTTIRLSLRESEDILGEFIPSVSYDEYTEFINFVKSLQVQLNTTYEFGQKAINKVLDLREEGKDVTKYINSHLIDIDDKKSDTSSLFIAKLAAQIMFNDKVVINCKHECQAKKLFEEIKLLIDDHNVYEKNDDVSFYNDMEYVNNNLNSIFKSIDDRSLFISKLPDNIKSMLLYDALSSKIRNLKVIYDDKVLNNYLTMITEYNRYKENLSKYDNEEGIIRQIKSVSNIDSIKEQMSALNEEIDTKETNVRNIKEDISILNSTLSDLNRTLDTDRDIFDALTKYDKIVSDNEKYKSDYDLYVTNTEAIHDLSIKLNGIITLFNSKSDKLREMQINLDQYNVLMKELESYNKIYDEMDRVKESLSAKSGIPLYIIRKYLGDDTIVSTNDLLNVVYNGDIELDSFDISPSAFSIPVYVRGFRMPDVKYTSQGELSFISIALSFALSSIVLARYNIMLLDEVDGPLDSDNREKFIKILEKQIDKIDSDQNFLITHNTLFSSYPVDIIDLSFKNDNKEYPLANFIEVERR